MVRQSQKDYYLTMLALIALAAFRQNPADVVVVNGRIWTDGRLTTATGLAVTGDKVAYVGRDLKPWIGPQTKVIDAHGHWVTPGLIDSHTHLVETGPEFKYDLDLRPATSKADFIQRVKNWTEHLPAGAWAQGSGWSSESYPEKQNPNREWLDPVTGDRPAVFSRMDGHSLVANSAALKRAHITKDGPKDPAGGSIERDPATGEPTGILTDNAMGLISTPLPTNEQTLRGLEATIDEAHRWGVTASGDIVNPLLVWAWQAYMKRPDRAFRVALYLRAFGPESPAAVKKNPSIPGWMEPHGVKLFMDGSLGSRSAYMAAPFAKPLPTQPADWRGLERPGAKDGTYAKIIAAAVRENVQVITHAIGDEANHDILDLYAQAPGVQTRRFRVEHAQHLLPADIKRFGQLGVIASMQPFHKADDGRYCEEIIGAERSRSSYAYRDLLKTNARLAFGSDFDVVTLNPWVGIATAVTGRISTGKVWMPHENISLDHALDAYTRGAAYSMFMENEIGRLAPGFAADFVVLDRAPKTDGTDIGKVKPDHVFEAGREVTVK